MKFVFLGIFIVFGLIHLFASKKQNKPLRNFTKGFIVLALFGWYVLSVENPSWIVAGAILASWLGDVLLIPHGTGWFVAGGISFMVSHALFVVAYVPNVDFGIVPWWAIVIIGIVYIAAVIYEFSILKKHLAKALFYPMFLYLLINGTMNSFAFFRLISVPCFATIVTAIGAVLFFISDSVLFNVRFNKESIFKTHFLVMLTYIVAEFLIVEGLILL